MFPVSKSPAVFFLPTSAILLLSLSPDEIPAFMYGMSYESFHSMSWTKLHHIFLDSTHSDSIFQLLSMDGLMPLNCSQIRNQPNSGSKACLFCVFLPCFYMKYLLRLEVSVAVSNELYPLLVGRGIQPVIVCLCIITLVSMTSLTNPELICTIS